MVKKHLHKSPPPPKLIMDGSENIMPGENRSAEQIINSWFQLPGLVKTWFKQALLFMVSIGVFIGGIMVIWGSIQWATDYGRGGRDQIIKGIALIIISLAPSLLTL